MRFWEGEWSGVCGLGRACQVKLIAGWGWGRPGVWGEVGPLGWAWNWCMLGV